MLSVIVVPKQCYGIDLFEETINQYLNDNLSFNRSVSNINNNNVSSNVVLIKGNSFSQETINQL